LYPALYQSYIGRGTAQQLQTERGKTSDQLGKLGQPETWPLGDHPLKPDKHSQRRRVGRHNLRTPEHLKKSFEEAVSEQMARGASTYEVAAQRVVNLYGNTLQHESFITKGLADSAVVQSRFHDLTDQFVDADAHSPRCEALRKARLVNAKLFKAYQSI